MDLKSELIKEISNQINESIILEVPPNPILGDYALPCFKLSKKPHEIQKLLKLPKFIEKTEIKGPYLNFFINKTFLAELTINQILKEKEKYGSKLLKERVVIEFPSPNTNKPLHIGHARNIILGQAVCNLLKFMGNEVIVVNLNNDRGVHICKSMLAYALFGNNDSPEKSNKKSDHFVGDYYVKFAKAAKENPKLEEEAQEYLRKWEAGDKKILELWKKMNNWAFEGFRETYKKFDLKIDKEYFESNIYKNGKEIILEALEKHQVQKKPEGAIFIDLSKEGLGEKILLRGDGTSIYITQDIYLAILKYKEFKFDKSIFVSAVEQKHHFKVLFTILKKLGNLWADKLYHLSYGMVNLESGRMKSREGNVVDSDDLIEELNKMAIEEIDKRYNEITKKEKEKRSNSIAMAALRYYYLKIDHEKDITFKPEESIRFEGDTGPYIQYTHARASSIIKKSEKTLKIKNYQLGEKESKLIKVLSEFPQAVENAHSQLSPHIITNYSFHLAQTFNEFYHSCQVLNESNKDVRLSRLALVKAAKHVLKNSLNLLGIEAPEQM